MKNFNVFIMCMVAASVGLAQSSVQGTATITVLDGGTDCNGLARRVEIHADLTGLIGDGNELAGLNGYVLAVSFDPDGSFTSATPGNQPAQVHWSLITTHETVIFDEVTLVGWWPEPSAPNGSYHLATLLFAGDPGPVTVAVEGTSSLASRLVSPTNRPDVIAYQLPNALVVTIPGSFNLDLLTGVASWLQSNALYDLTAPAGDIDIRDLCKLVSCSPP